MNLGEQETLITVALPEATRANSAEGGLDNGVLAEHDLRFILEIYQGKNCYRMESIGSEPEATFPVRVVQGHEYDFVVWADFVKKGAKVDDDTNDDLYYNTESGLDEITIKDNVAMTEARDAYYGVAHLDADKAVSTISNITLTRPFAKVRVITTDLSECIEKLGLQPQEATVTYTTDTYDKFDARNKNVWSLDANDNEKKVNYLTSTYGEDNLFVDYILVPQGTQSTVKFDLNVTNVINRSFNTDIAVEANKITTIKGNILTNGSDIKVDVNDDFASETIYLEGDVTLTEDLVIDRPMVVRDNATAVLNLNGHKIINTTGTADYESEGIIVYGNLTINDETGKGLIEANSRAIWARGNYGATITINGGNYVGAHLNTEVIYASGNGQIEINGGTFEALTASSGHGSAGNRPIIILNLHGNGASGCSIVVKGGSFKNFDPANNIAENPKHNFCAEGYVSVENGDWFEVVNAYTSVASATEIQEALANGENVILSGDIAVTQSEAGSNGYGATGINTNGGIIDGNGNNFSADVWGTWDSAISATNGTIKNLNITGGFRGIFMPGADADVYIDKVTFNNVVYTFNSDGGNKNYGVYISNSILNGWTSFSEVHKEVVFTNCTFGKGNGYAFCRPYNPCVFENCEFSTDMEFDTTMQQNIVFKNCTYGAVKITAENAATLTTFFYNGVGSVSFE